jgi:hypothetical protein
LTEQRQSACHELAAAARDVLAWFRAVGVLADPNLDDSVVILRHSLTPAATGVEVKTNLTLAQVRRLDRAVGEYDGG